MLVARGSCGSAGGRQVIDPQQRSPVREPARGTPRGQIAGTLLAPPGVQSGSPREVAARFARGAGPQGLSAFHQECQRRRGPTLQAGNRRSREVRERTAFDREPLVPVSRLLTLENPQDFLTDAGATTWPSYDLVQHADALEQRGSTMVVDIERISPADAGTALTAWAWASYVGSDIRCLM